MHKGEKRTRGATRPGRRRERAFRRAPGARSSWLAGAAFLAALAGAGAAGARTDGEAARLFAADGFTLDNGMQVVVLENHRAPVVVHMVWYRVGAADDPPGKSGLAHFLEHLMFKGTARAGPGEFSREIAARGGSDGAFTAADYTAYFQRVARAHLEFAMEFEADRMRNLALSESLVEPERAVILEERGSRTDTAPGALLAEQVTAAQFLNHPYGTPIIGWRHEIETLTRADALAFYDRHYVPDNAILIVAGAITAEALRPLAEKHYGAIAPGTRAARGRPREPPQIGPRRVELVDGRAAQARLVRSYLAPSHAAGDSQHALPLQLLAELLGGGTVGRLHRTLVVDAAIAPWAAAHYAGARDETRFTLYAAAFPGQAIAPVEAALDAALAAFLADGPDEEEVAAARERMIARATYALDDPRTLAHVYGTALATGHDLEAIESWPSRLAAVTGAQVLAAARAVLRPERSVTGILRPAEEDDAEED